MIISFFGLFIEEAWNEEGPSRTGIVLWMDFSAD